MPSLVELEKIASTIALSRKAHNRLGLEQGAARSYNVRSLTLKVTKEVLLSTNVRSLVLSDRLFPQVGLTRNALLVLGGSLAVALLAQASVRLPFTPVPITGQTLGVLLVGTLLGSRLGALAVGLYVLEGAAGLPVYAGLKGGLPVLLGPTGGYLLGFVVAAYAVGWLAERRWDRHVFKTVTAMLFGNALIYAVGLPWLGQLVGWESVLNLGLWPFVPGDLLKVALAAALLPSAWRWVRRGE